MLDWACRPVVDEGSVQATDQRIECRLDAQRLVEYINGGHHRVDGGHQSSCCSGDFLKEIGNGASGINISGWKCNFLPPTVVTELD